MLEQLRSGKLKVLLVKSVLIRTHRFKHGRWTTKEDLQTGAQELQKQIGFVPCEKTFDCYAAAEAIVHEYRHFQQDQGLANGFDKNLGLPQEAEEDAYTFVDQWAHARRIGNRANRTAKARVGDVSQLPKVKDWDGNEVPGKHEAFSKVSDTEVEFETIKLNEHTHQPMSRFVYYPPREGEVIHEYSVNGKWVPEMHELHGDPVPADVFRCPCEASSSAAMPSGEASS